LNQHKLATMELVKNKCEDPRKVTWSSGWPT